MEGIAYFLNMSSAEQLQTLGGFGLIIAEVLLVTMPLCWYFQWNDVRREALAQRWGKEI